MTDLTTNYLGLTLPNPVLVSSSGMTEKLDKLKACEDAGAGGVVLKSLFEEQISADTDSLMDGVDLMGHTDAFDFFKGMGHHHAVEKYLELIEGAKKSLSIPVIASLNAVNDGAWIDYANKIEKLGADAIEVNLFIIPANVDETGAEIEKRYLSIMKKLREKVQIPLAVKIGPHFSGMANMIREFQRLKINGVTLFNRFYRPDVDIERMKIIPAKIFSVAEEMALSLQWIALLSGELSIDFSATTGIHDAKAVVKQLLVGAKAVQMCSSLYKNGIEYLTTVVKELAEWMDRHQFSSIEDFRGKLSQEQSMTPQVYERSQYIKALVGIS
ncbi:MAG: dihydroorotate dehydrogenase-like protein [Spirochaetales bacterium]|nr:dihydroorotate dehydrogenase-like protein [Spirochaetales bacterium]